MPEVHWIFKRDNLVGLLKSSKEVCKKTVQILQLAPLFPVIFGQWAAPHAHV